MKLPGSRKNIPRLVPAFILEQFAAGKESGRFEAVALAVDISGFTPLTETLFRHDTNGAEVLGDTLEEIFSPLVKQVEANGGLIPLYAGDAFTAIFAVTAGQEYRIVEAEFREICPVFITFSPPNETKVLHQWIGALMIIVKQYGGVFGQLEFNDQGGVILLWFGAPVSYENNAIALTTLFKALSLQRPLLIHIEDAHWLDSDSERLITTLCKERDRSPLPNSSYLLSDSQAGQSNQSQPDT